jgi:hypothetical protein
MSLPRQYHCRILSTLAASPSSTVHCKPCKRLSGAITQTRMASYRYWYPHPRPIVAAWHPFQSYILATLRHSVLSTTRHSSVMTSTSKSPWRPSSASATSSVTCSHSERRSERILGFDHVCSHDLSRVQSRSRTRNNAGTSARPLECQRWTSYLSRLQRCSCTLVINDGNLKGDMISTVLVSLWSL